jgi:hypothetical protein
MSTSTMPATRGLQRPCFPTSRSAKIEAAHRAIFPDVYSLLQQPSVQAFVGTAPYLQHKDDHFPQADNKNISENVAFQLPDVKTRALYERAYEAGSALYYQGKPTFTEILATLDEWKDRL